MAIWQDISLGASHRQCCQDTSDVLEVGLFTSELSFHFQHHRATLLTSSPWQQVQQLAELTGVVVSAYSPLTTEHSH